jgi:hypothetical protein
MFVTPHKSQSKRGGNMGQSVSGGTAPQQYDIVRWSLLKNIWPFLVAFFVIAAAWVNVTVEVGNLRRDFNTLQTAYNNHLIDVAQVRAERDQQYLEIQITLTAIQKDILYIRDSLQDTSTP